MQVVVPVKSFKNAKKRLASVLTAGQRSDLMKHMLDDVLRAIAAVTELEAITVVTSDAEVAQWVDSCAQGIKTPLRVFDPGPHPVGANYLAKKVSPAPIKNLAEAGLCHAYRTAASELIGKGASTMLLLPADIPLITKADIRALLAEHTRPGVTLATAGSDGGTNALLVSPPDIIAPAFGENSCQRHSAHAREQGCQPRLLNNFGFSLDIDTVDDIRALLASDRECATLRYLRESGIAGELEKSERGGHLPSTKIQQSGLQNQINRHLG
ncbi:MAG: 2-phospho-L-lactate guanylyltransferase [Porticoccaceae bacterium]|nr:2-phospho-L-lactate guanylyltransferase [Porticoccaceae bacterium]